MPIYSDATLGVNEFRVQLNSGGTWVDTATLQTNQKYRFRAYFKNHAPNSFDSAMYGPHIFVTDIVVSVTLLGAKFDSTGTHEGGDRVLSSSYAVDDHPDFNRLIKPQGALWASFAAFTWIGASSPVSQRPVDFRTGHREIRWVGSAPWAKLVPTT